MQRFVQLKEISVPPPSEDDRRADDQRLRDTLGMGNLHIPLTVLRKMGHQGTDDFSCVLAMECPAPCLVDIHAQSSCSIALDLGTTNLAALLYNNVTRQTLCETKAENPQTGFGSDILTRMHHAMMGQAEEIGCTLRDGVNRVIDELCTKGDVERESIHALTVAGNTVMSHFFLGLDVSRIPAAPFVPVVRSPGFFKASELQLHVHPEARIYVFPNAGSYVGGDILAGILASGMHRSDDVSILIDVGTNAEVVVGNSEWMLVGAGAAGPALEEGIAAVGRRADRGIIYDVEIRGRETFCRTFDDAPPEGICGSGMVSLVYEMHCAGIIGDDGILDQNDSRVRSDHGDVQFCFSCGSGSELIIKQTEIDNFLRSKSAMFTLLLVLLRSVGLQFSDVKTVYVAGALGSGINVQKAASIGMIPGWSPDQIIPLGNGSLQGAEKMLRDRSMAEQADAILGKITYKHMHDDPEFMKEFRGGMFIPHTNPELLQVAQRS